MFGENILLGQKEMSIDSKGRLIIPSETKREKDDVLVLLYNQELDIYEIYSIKKVEEMFEELSEKILLSNTKTEERNYKRKLYEFSKSILRCEKVDLQGRILTGKVFENQEKVLSIGAYDHLIIEPMNKK